MKQGSGAVRPKVGKYKLMGGGLFLGWERTSVFFFDEGLGIPFFFCNPYLSEPINK